MNRRNLLKTLAFSLGNLALPFSSLYADDMEAIYIESCTVEDEGTRIVFASKSDIKARTMVLQNPHRVAIDFANRSFMPGSPNLLYSDPLIKLIRTGRPNSVTARMVFDLNQAAKVTTIPVTPNTLTGNRLSLLFTPIASANSSINAAKPEENAQDKTSISTKNIMQNEFDTNFFFQSDSPIDYQSLHLINPRRFVIDFKNAGILQIAKLKNFSNSAISEIRTGHPFPNISRIVFNLADTTSQASHQLLVKDSQEEHKQIHQLVVTIAQKPIIIETVKPEATIYKVEEPLHQKSIIVESDHTPLLEQQENINISSTELTKLELEQPQKSAEQTDKTAPNKEVSSTKQRAVLVRHLERRIVIDPGHGGIDPGTIGIEGTREKDVALAVAKTIKKQFANISGCTAFLTRENDDYISLNRRLEIAKNLQADLFLSLHADAFRDPLINGASVYLLKEPSFSSSEQLENEFPQLHPANVNNMQQTTLTLTTQLGMVPKSATQLIQSKEVKLKTNKFGNRLLSSLQQEENIAVQYHRIKRAEFKVLKTPGIPSALVEMGFLSNINDERKIRDKKYQETLSAALSQGIIQQLKLT